MSPDSEPAAALAWAITHLRPASSVLTGSAEASAIIAAIERLPVASSSSALSALLPTQVFLHHALRGILAGSISGPSIFQPVPTTEWVTKTGIPPYLLSALQLSHPLSRAAHCAFIAAVAGNAISLGFNYAGSQCHSTSDCLLEVAQAVAAGIFEHHLHPDADITFAFTSHSPISVPRDVFAQALGHIAVAAALPIAGSRSPALSELLLRLRGYCQSGYTRYAFVVRKDVHNVPRLPFGFGFAWQSLLHFAEAISHLHEGHSSLDFSGTGSFEALLRRAMALITIAYPTGSLSPNDHTDFVQAWRHLILTCAVPSYASTTGRLSLRYSRVEQPGTVFELQLPSTLPPKPLVSHAELSDGTHSAPVPSSFWAVAEQQLASCEAVVGHQKYIITNR
jgi:hypothetical protein